MYKDIKINLNPYLGCSNNLMEFFIVIGYEEEILNEFIINANKGEKEEKLNVSIISYSISEKAFNLFNSDYIIKQVYPDNPEIIIKEEIPKPTSVVFSSCYDSLDGTKKLFYSCYGLKFYEKYIDIFKNEYYVPKAFLILSQYPYFSTFKKICEKVLEYKKNDKNDIDNKIPIEILMHCFVNYIPSPINDSLLLNDFSPTIIIQRLTGYPYCDFDLCKIFNIIPINEFIKIYIIIFLELDLLFFSSDLEKLNIFMYILYILNYPLTDSIYFWHIKTIPKNMIKDGSGVPFTSFMGVNTEYNSDLNLSAFTNFNFIIDMDYKHKKNIINLIKSNKESEKINQLLKYIDHILKKKLRIKKVESFFLADSLFTLKNKLKEIKKDYKNLMKENTIDSFFYINKDINEINRRIQETFYDFILNILVVLNKDFEIDNELKTPIKKRNYINPKLSEEEKTFLNYSRMTVKYNTYFELFLTEFKAVDEIKVSLLFSNEYVNLKMKDINKKIPNNIKYFDIMDKIYSLKPQIKEINFKFLYDEYKANNDVNKFFYISYIINKKKNQLFSFNQDLIKIFIFQKKNRNCYQILKKEKELNVAVINKISVPFTILNYFHKVLSAEYYTRSSLIYIFSIIFPLLSFQDSLIFLQHIFRNLKIIKFFQRYYLNIILKSIHKYYILNQEIGQFPEFIPNNIINYCQLINNHLKNNYIIPNEEIFNFFKTILAEKGKSDKIIFKNKENKNNKYVFHNKEEDFVKNINEIVVTKEGNSLIYNYKGFTKKCDIFGEESLIFQQIYAFHDDYFNINFNLENLNFTYLKDVIINIIFLLYKYKELEIANLLINVIILLNGVENDIKNYKIKINNIK